MDPIMYKCSECKYTSTRSYTVNRHYKSHHAGGQVKLIQCSLCKCNFNNSTELNKHNATKKHIVNELLFSLNQPCIETTKRSRRSPNKKLI